MTGQKKELLNKTAYKSINGRPAWKLFGVALDASDDPFSLDLKHAAMDARERGVEGIAVDPYETFLQEFLKGEGIEPAGRFAVPSWLGTIPQPADKDLVTRERMQQFIDEGGISKMADDVRDFVKNRVLPSRPIMVGIDHSATAGVVSALSEQVGPQNLTVLVLDRHFDGIPLSTRMAAFSDRQASAARPSNNQASCCGDFWAPLIGTGSVDPRHLVFLGVADYPPAQVTPEWEEFRECYMAYAERGCTFLPLEELAALDEEGLRAFLLDAITTPYVYVSLDLDVGAFRAVHAARYMDGPGVGAEKIMSVARIINEEARTGAFELAGLDIVEFNMHFLGLDTPTGERDRTLETAVAFARAITGG